MGSAKLFNDDGLYPLAGKPLDEKDIALLLTPHT